jgi:RNA polymerase sigma-70 factor, ECF subfamily
MPAPRREIAGAAAPERPERPEHRLAEEPRTLPTAAYPGWEAIYADNVERIYRLMYAKVGNRHDAEDLTSQVFLTAFGPLRTTASVGEVRAYLLTTARTVLATHWRSTLGHQVTVIDVGEAGLEDFTPGPAPDERSGQADDRIGRILAGLPERHRAILTLRFLRGYSIKAAAAELGVSVANAKVLQHRALRRAAGLDKEGEAS